MDKFTFQTSVMKKIRIICLAIFSICFFTAKSFAQINSSQVMPLDPKVKIGRLANGLTYYIRHNNLPEKRVEMRLVVNAGSVQEDDDQHGLAHFMEHMNFNGTKHFPKNELVSYLQSIGVEFGADLNAYTSFDQTIYILPVPTDKPELVQKGLEILEDWAHNALLDSVEIEKERGVVIEEWRISRGADERMMKQTLPIEYKGSKYADHIPIGTKASLDNFKQDALRRFYKDWYRPDLEAIVIVGDIDVNEMEQKIIEQFSTIPMPESPREKIDYEVPDYDEPLITVAKDKENAFSTVRLMYKKDKKPETTVGDYSQYINRNLFTGMLNNRLRELTLQPNPPFVNAFSYYGGSYARTKDAFEVAANTSDTGMAHSLYTLLQENRRILLHGFTQNELDLQKKQMISFYERIFNEREKEESYNYVDEYVNNFLYDEPIPGIEWEYDFVKQYLNLVTLKDINELAPEWITQKNLVVVLNAPDKADVKIPTEETIKKIFSAVAMAKIPAYESRALATSLMDDSKLKKGKIVDTKSNNKLGITTLHLSNGATVVLKQTNFKNNQILFRAFSNGGHSLVKDKDFYSAIYADQIIEQSGIGNLNAIDLGNLLKGKNTNVSPYITQYREGLNGSSTPSELKTLFQLIYLYTTSPRKDSIAFHSFITRGKQYFANLNANPQIYFSGEFQKLMSQNHPRAVGIPQPSDLDKIDLDRTLAVYKERFDNAGDFTYFFVGSFDEDSIQSYIEKYIGSLPSTHKKENFKDLGIRPPKGLVKKEFHKGSDPKGTVYIDFTQPALYSAKDAFTLSCLSDIMNIKLIEQLREEKSDVYGISVSGTFSRVPVSASEFTIAFPCAPEKIDTLKTAIFAELQNIMDNGITSEDLNKIKEQKTRRLEVDVKQNRFWIDNLYTDYLYGTNPEEILNRQKQIDNLTSDMIQQVAKKYINLKAYILATLKPEATEDAPKKSF